MSLSFDIAPFYDDSAVPGGAIDNNYMRILFRPGYAVQARELTALQSILQNQISTLGSFVFQDGSPVSGGHISIDTTVWAVQLQPQYANTDINLNDFLVNGSPTLILNGTGTVKAMVVGTDSTNTNPIIIVKYFTATQFSNTDTIQVATGLQSLAYVQNSNNYTNPASTASINDGVFYSGGFFVDVPAQTIVLNSTTNYPSYFVGLSISENIIDETTDSSLLDPAQGSFNYQAPGAERYQYELTLDKRSPTSTDFSAFYSLLTVTNGLITQQVDYPIFADLDKALAQRTYDTSGDFTVHPFVVSTQDNAANTAQYYLIVEPGKAYVKGFEFETIGTQKLVSDKARTTNTVTDYGMSVNYGNYLTVGNLYGGNVSGIFDYTQYQSIDLHLTNSANINTTNSQAYAQTKIGTARVRDIEYVGPNTYYTYLTEVKMNTVNFIATGGGLLSINVPSGIYTSMLYNVYANIVATVNTAGVVDVRRVSEYLPATSGNNVLGFYENLSIPSNSTTNVTVAFGMVDVLAGVVPPNTFSSNVYSTQTTSLNSYASFDVSSAGIDVSGNTIIADTQYNKLIFPLSQNYIAQNTIINASFETRRNLWSTTFTSGSLTVSSGTNLATGESFPFNYSGLVPSATVNENIMVIVRNAMSSGYANGQILNFSVGGNTVTQSSTTSLVIAASSSSTFIADVILTVVVTNATSASVALRSKNLVGNAAQTYIQSGTTLAGATQVVGSSPANAVYVDTTHGYIWFTSNAAMAMSPGARQSLYVPDVFSILRILDSGNINWSPSNSNTALGHDIDITSNYYLDSGQRDNFYDFAKLILKPGANPPSGQTVVLCQYYQSDTIASPVYGFFTANSYSSAVYNAGLIPYYNSTNYGLISLRDSIDFRPVRTIGTSANVNNFNLNGLMVPQPDASMTLTFGYYLPRVDKLMLSKDKVFRIEEGVPAQYPVPPADADDAMTLYIITLPAYTGNVDQIQLQYVEHKRYTMQDIGFLDTRIQELELLSDLSTLEQKTLNEKILYQDGVTAKDIFGSLTDDFSDFSICDNQNNDLRCYLAQGSMTPYKDQINFGLQFQSNTGAYYQEGKCYILPFTEVPAVAQNAATEYVTVQPFLFAQFKGTTRLTPQTLGTYSQNLAPQIIAPPASTAPEQPPASPPVGSPVIAATAPQQATIVVAGTNENPVNYSAYWDYWYYRSGQSFYYRVYRYTTGYGSVSPLYNWYGVPVATTTTTPAYTIAPNGGSAIQLAAGTASNTAARAVSARGAAHLFGKR